MRQIQVSGHIVANAEKKISSNGKEFLKFRIGNNEFNDGKDASGNPKTFWISVTSFNQRHFGLMQYLVKGKPIIVCGDYSDGLFKKNDGSVEITHDIMANSIYFISDGNNNSNSESGTTTTAATPTEAAPKAEAKKPTTAELKVPVNNEAEAKSVPDNDEDSLPF